LKGFWGVEDAEVERVLGRPRSRSATVQAQQRVDPGDVLGRPGAAGLAVQIDLEDFGPVPGCRLADGGDRADLLGRTT
jgi:hypothetical protein